jgi:hypothetical protein
MKKIFLFAALFLLFNLPVAYSQQSDSAYTRMITELETRISQVKALPKEQLAKYHPLLSDVENRKNNMIFLMKTPAEKRDDSWAKLINQNYTKASEKLDKIPLR